MLGRSGPHWQPDHEPGARFQYVNLNFGVVATVMERATGERADRLMQRLVLQPLGVRGGLKLRTFRPPIRPTSLPSTASGARSADCRVWNPGLGGAGSTTSASSPPHAATAGPELQRRPGTGRCFADRRGGCASRRRDLGVVMQMLPHQGRLARTRLCLRPAAVALMAQRAGRCWRGARQRRTDRGRAWCETGGAALHRTPPAARAAATRLVRRRLQRLGAWATPTAATASVRASTPPRTRHWTVLVLGPDVDSGHEA